MSADHPHGDIIIIKKKVVGGGGHHGGAWKIAFADFMTAMMAFFLVLWIINASDKETKTVIARYFNPVKLENPSKAKKGVHGATSAPTEGKEDKSDKANAPPAKDQKDAKGSPLSAESKGESKQEGAKTETETAEAKAKAAEAQLFTAPYESLDKIAGAASNASAGASPDKGDADPQRLAGALSIDSFRDPFKPIGPGSPDDPIAFDADARNKAPPDVEPGKTGQEEKPRETPLPNATPAAKRGEKAALGEAAKPAPNPAGGAADAGAQAEGAKAGADAAKIEKELREKVAAALNSGAGPDIEARQTKDGLLISLTDKLDFSMFSVGSAEPRPEIVRAMEAVAKIVKERQGHIIVRGYTDARPYKNGAYDNWRLSSDRAQMAYYMLTRGGAPAARFTRVEGYADRAPRDPGHPLAAVNRRLEILIEEPRT
jgi:chemotaxis protein MotB